MRYYATLPEAMSEIRRDLAKGPRVISTRVQQHTEGQFPGREILGYTYSIDPKGFPQTAEGLVALGQKLQFSTFNEHADEMISWLKIELACRVDNSLGTLTEIMHPALKSTIEGNWPAYTYAERLHGAMDALQMALKTPDTRRAYWPIFRPEDALRAFAPTRIPCSLGYQAIIRNTSSGPELNFFYLQRSADFDTFFLSDIWLANRFKEILAERLEIAPGQFIHNIISLHSFQVEGTEIY